MRCLSCHKLSISTFCKACKLKLLTPTVTKQSLNGLDVYSFFKYENIQDLLLTKYTSQGFKVYRALAKLSFKPFIQKFMALDNRTLYVMGIDENVKGGYSHVAQLTHALSHQNVNILHAKLMAMNRVKYAGKSLEFRLENPRAFECIGFKNMDVILIDDIITTGTTLKEAEKVLNKNGINVLFALTLAYVEV